MRVSRYVATYQANARDETLQARKPRWRWEKCPPFIVRQFERAYTAELKRLESDERFGRTKKPFTIQDASMK